MVICFSVCFLALQPWGQRASGSLSFAHTRATWIWIPVKPKLCSLHRNLSPSICRSAVPVQLPPGRPRRRFAAHPETGQMLPPASQRLAAFGPASRRRHSSGAEPRRILNPFSVSFGKENIQGTWHLERKDKRSSALCLSEEKREREMKFNRLFVWMPAQDTQIQKTQGWKANMGHIEKKHLLCFAFRVLNPLNTRNKISRIYRNKHGGG